MDWFAKRRMAGRLHRHLLGPPWGYAAWETSDDLTRERRRAQRVDLSAAVFLYGLENTEPFCEHSRTIDVSINGALVSANARLFVGQRILLTNLQTQQDLTCQVVRIDTRRIAAALEFLERDPRFWRIDFIPASSQG
jgi:hypothetical protein